LFASCVTAPIGQVASHHVRTFQRNRRTNHVLQVNVRTDGPTFGVSFFTPYHGQVEKWQAEMAVGARGMFVGQAKRFNDTWQLDKAHHLMFGGDDATRLSGLLPVYPLTSKLYTWDLMKVVGAALDMVAGVEDVFTPELRARFDVVEVWNGRWESPMSRRRTRSWTR
jgi:ATP-dependent DNA helicase RecG